MTCRYTDLYACSQAQIAMHLHQAEIVEIRSLRDCCGVREMQDWTWALRSSSSDLGRVAVSMLIWSFSLDICVILAVTNPPDFVCSGLVNLAPLLI